MRLECAKCDALLCGPLLSNDYQLCAGSQAHLTNEVYTDAVPVAGLVDVTTPGHPAGSMLNCPNNCHGPLGLWLVDAGSGVIALNGKAFGYACGPDYVRIVSV